MPGAACDGDCLVVREWTPADPGSEAFKYYAPGIGLIFELEGDLRIELMSFDQP